MDTKKIFSKKNLISIFIVFIMTSSILGYMGGRNNNTQKYEYDGQDIYRKDNGWYVKKDSKEIIFHFFPDRLSDINTTSNISNILKNKVEIDSTSNPKSQFSEEIALAQYLLQQNLLKTSNTYFVKGMNKENEHNLPIITCKNATSSVPVIYFKKANTTEIILENNCLIAKAKSDTDILRIKDKLMYELIGINTD